MRYFSKTKVYNTALLTLAATVISSFPQNTIADKIINNKNNGVLLRKPSSTAVSNGKVTKEEIHPRRSLTGGCSTNKKVTMVKFCIQGYCDPGEEGEHRLKLDGDWLYDGFRDYKQDTCHSISYSKVVEGWKSLTVGTEEHDSMSQHDSYFATLSNEEWYNPTCEKYTLALSKPHSYAGSYSICMAQSSPVFDFFNYESCGSIYDYPEESFTWELEIEPDDSSPPNVLQTCKKEKKVSMYKFCIEGDCDIGAEGMLHLAFQPFI